MVFHWTQRHLHELLISYIWEYGYVNIYVHISTHIQMDKYRNIDAIY